MGSLGYLKSEVIKIWKWMAKMLDQVGVMKMPLVNATALKNIKPLGTQISLSSYVLLFRILVILPSGNNKIGKLKV